jgi:hypothetical protein
MFGKQVRKKRDQECKCSLLVPKNFSPAREREVEPVANDYIDRKELMKPTGHQMTGTYQACSL